MLVYYEEVVEIIALEDDNCECEKIGLKKQIYSCRICPEFTKFWPKKMIIAFFMCVRPFLIVLLSNIEFLTD